MRTAPIAAALAALLAAACATPEVAEDYRTRTFVPAELAAALASDDPTARADAAGQVESMEPAKRRAALLELSRDERAPVRLLAVGLLGRHHAAEEEAAGRLAEMLSLDPDADVRVAAVEGLGRSGRVDALRPLVDALSEDASLSVKRAAASTLDRLTGQALAADFLEKVDAAESAADDAMMSYDDWLGANGATLRYDAGSGRFVPAR